MNNGASSVGEHAEPHFELSASVRDVIIGMSDGLTVPFAIAAGLASAAATDATIIIAAVLSEIAAGSISMGLGGYLAARTDAEHYQSERVREELEVEELPDVEEREVMDALEHYGLTSEESGVVAKSLRARKKDWVDFMMRFELGLEKPSKHRAAVSASTIAVSYAVGGLIPLSPYLFISSVNTAFIYSVVVTLCALLVFGFIRGQLIGRRPWRSMLQTALIGAVAAAAAFALAKLVPQ